MIKPGQCPCCGVVGMMKGSGGYGDAVCQGCGWHGELSVTYGDADLRDRLAMAALTGVLANGNISGEHSTYESRAEFVYKQADAMLAERKIIGRGKIAEPVLCKDGEAGRCQRCSYGSQCKLHPDYVKPEKTPPPPRPPHDAGRVRVGEDGATPLPPAGPAPEDYKGTGGDR